MRLFTHQDSSELAWTVRELGSGPDWMDLFLDCVWTECGRRPPLTSLSSCSRFRQMCQSIIAHKLFDYVVLAFIFSNCITVALERPKILQGSLVNPSDVCVCVCSLCSCSSSLHFLCGSFLCSLRINSVLLSKRCSK